MFKWDRAESALSSPGEEFCPATETASRSIPTQSASVLLVKVSALEPPSPSLLTDEYSLKKNHFLKATYWTNIDICSKFLSAVHYLTSFTDCPNPANNSVLVTNSFNSFVTAPEHLLRNNDFYYLTSTPVKVYFVSTFSVVALQKQRKEDTWWHLWRRFRKGYKPCKVNTSIPDAEEF